MFGEQISGDYRLLPLNAFHSDWFATIFINFTLLSKADQFSAADLDR